MSEAAARSVPQLKRASRIKSFVLRSDRLTLRPPVMDDALAVETGMADYGVVSNLSRAPWPYEHRHAIEWLGSVVKAGDERSQYPFAIVTGEGLAGVIGISAREEGVELGYWLRRSAWGKGYATEAGRLALGFAFDELELDVVEAGHFADNAASGRVLQKLGFTYTQDVPRYSLARDCDVACRMMILPRARFAEGRTKGGASHGG